MMYFIRILLIFLIIFLVVRSFINAGTEKSDVSDGTDKRKDSGRRRGVPKSLGEYVDFEEVEKDD